ncbi:MAG: SDR family NAD(P)-dependent oxidoreductase [Ktedonobacterales bacterium]|nr:SDR family NAD(P)-dependent oxidoreductase [Ktedonobacterales bacterium]
MRHTGGTRVAIITGASSGIGAATARALARQGYAVAINARRSERLAALAQDIATAGGQTLAIAGDITEAATRRALITATLERFGRLDVLINNAGMAITGTTETLSTDAIRAQFELNVLAPIELTRLALPELRRHRGVIINVVSLAAVVATPPVGIYSATKYALAGWTEALRRELLATGVRVCQVNPGPVTSEFVAVSGINPRLHIGAVTADRVARAIARLARRPRRLVTVPRVLGPVAGLARLFPAGVDAAYALAARVRPDFMSRAGPRPSAGAGIAQQGDSALITGR